MTDTGPTNGLAAVVVSAVKAHTDEGSAAAVTPSPPVVLSSLLARRMLGT